VTARRDALTSSLEELRKAIARGLERHRRSLG
jgi:hypothetical protein